MPTEDLLLALRDIQAPATPGWWPLAAGWWILLTAFLFCLIFWIIVKRRRRLNYFQIAERELKRFASQYRLDKDKQRLLLGLSHWLRQVAILAHPQRQIAGLTGRKWVNFLDESMPGHEFTEGQGQIFAGEVYSEQTQIDAENILALCRSWLDRVKRELLP